MTVRSAWIPAVAVLLAFLCSAPGSLAQAPTQLPPRVIACTPAPFATDVEATLTQISVTFDRPMRTQGESGFAAIRFLGVFPGVRERAPRWNAEGTVCSLPVILDPDVTYAVTVNSTARRGFTDAAGIPALAFTWVFATGARTEAELPPCVVSSDPPQGAAEVDATTTEISVTLNRPIAPGDFSWVLMRGSGQYPGERGGDAPRLSADRLTATLQVHLTPGTAYALSVNDVSYFGYKDTFGRPVVPYGWCFKTAGEPPAPD